METTHIRDIGKKIYRKVPTSLRWFFWPVRLPFRLMDISKLDLWILNGEETTSHQELSIFYAGTEINRNYIAKLAYDTSYSKTHLGKVWIWQIPNVVREKGRACSLVVIAVHKLLWRFLAKRTYFSIPFWVSSRGDISPDDYLLAKNKSVESDIRRIRNNKLLFEITQNPSQFDNFYHNMYRPYIAVSHGSGAIIAEYDYMKKEFKNGELLLIKKEDEYIAGGLMVYKKKLWRPAYLGVKDGNSSYVKNGAIAAIFLFWIRVLRQKGQKELDLGSSRPFLKDGVLRYKRKWGGYQISSSPEADGTYYIEPLADTPGLRAFLTNNPFIFIDKGKINAAIFVDCERGFSQEEIATIYKDYYFDGMSKLYIYQFGNSRNLPRGISASQFSDRIEFSSAEKLFQKGR